MGMSNQLVSENDIDAALSWLSSNDYEMATAAAAVDRSNELKKVLIAELKKASKGTSDKAKEAEALASPEYRKYLDEHYELVKHERHLKLQAAYYNTKIDVWRTIQANQRRGQV